MTKQTFPKRAIFEPLENRRHFSATPEADPGDDASSDDQFADWYPQAAKFDPTNQGTLNLRICWGEECGDYATLPDGKSLYVVDDRAGHQLILKFNAAGTPDPSFGSNGQLATVFANGDLFFPTLSILSNGSFYVTDTANDHGTTVSRYLADGSLDASFGAGGIARIMAPGRPWMWDDGAALLPDNKLLIEADVGIPEHPSCGDGWETVVMRMNADGTLDQSFGTNGVSKDLSEFQRLTDTMPPTIDLPLEPLFVISMVAPIGNFDLLSVGLRPLPAAAQPSQGGASLFIYKITRDTGLPADDAQAQLL
jgi:uncharacterized delta-60 repeat protein